MATRVDLKTSQKSQKRTFRVWLKQFLFLFLFYNFLNCSFFCFSPTIYSQRNLQSSRQKPRSSAHFDKPALVWQNGKCLQTACYACFCDYLSRYLCDLEEYICFKISVNFSPIDWGLSEGVTCFYRLFLYFPSVTTILPLKQFYLALFHQDVWGQS